MEVWIEGPSIEAKPFIDFFIRSRCTLAESPQESDLVVFAGGSDVNPDLYGAKKHHTTSYVNTRDQRDLELYDLCYTQGIPMLGVCRGAQFGWVMSGGKLFQDVDNHFGNHTMYDPINKVNLEVTSVHHQMCAPSPNTGAEIIGYSAMSNHRVLAPNVTEHGACSDIEAFFIRDACFLGIQGHPEYSNASSEFKFWAYSAIENFVNLNPDLELRDRFRRMKRDAMEQRKVPFEIVENDLEEVCKQLA